MIRGTLIKFLFFIFLHCCTGTNAFSQRSDTLYMNSKWQICEKPFASYYRFGKIVIDTFWYYRGYVADYYMTDTMEMEGTYSDIGEKNGLFVFYYPNGNTKAKGNYVNNHLKGEWEYYYRNGNLRMRVDYAGDDRNFIVTDFQDSTGKSLAKNGTGSFEMYVDIPSRFSTYRLEGEFKDGKRDGTWKFYGYIPAKEHEEVMIKEVYDKGELKKGFIYSSFTGLMDTYKKPIDNIKLIEYGKLKATEYFSKDPTSFRNMKDDQDLADFLIKRETPAFDVEGESFEESFEDVFKTLNTTTVIRYFNNPEKIYNGIVTLNLSDSGNIEEIEITGNLTEKEKEYMTFFFKKFKNIHDITVENVSIDAYHKIYFYSVIFAEFVPKRYLSSLPEKQFLFAPVPYEKLKEMIKNKKKKGKKN